MISNYFKLAWRNIINRKFYAFLNIGGLAIALSCCMLIYLYASYNLSFDTFHKDADKIFRLVLEVHFDKIEYDKGSPYIENKTAIREFPQVEKGAFLIANQSFVVNANNKRFQEDQTVSFANSDWFNLFHHQLLSGSFSDLDAPGNVILRAKTARKYFGEGDAVGKVMLINGNAVKVAGVIADAPYNTDLRWDMYISFKSMQQMNMFNDKYFLTHWDNWGSMYTSFVMLKNADDKGAVEALLLAESKKQFGANYKTFGFKLLPLQEVHFDTRYGGTVQKPLLWDLGIIGILVLTIAVINYINIVVAQQTKRGIEIGTRKVLGGTRNQIFMQFIVESLLNTAIAISLAVVFVQIMLPQANNWLFKDEPVHILSYTKMYAFVGLMLVIITIGTGVYPALLLSRVSIAQALKNKFLNMRAGFGRKALVVFQNTVTQALIVCTIIIITQVHYLRNTDIGFDRESVVTIPVGQLSATQKEQFDQYLRSTPAVRSFTYCHKPPASNSMRGSDVDYDNRAKWEVWPVRYAIGDSAYCRTFGLHLVAGRNIRDKQPTPEFLVNQTMAHLLEPKHPEYVIGKKLTAGDTKGAITGIVKDFNVRSLVGVIEPSVLLGSAEQQTNLAIKLSGNQISGTLTGLQKQFQHILPEQIFSYQFVDEQIAELYKKENIQQKLIWLAAMVAIVISSLGLLGLVSLVALQRTKEIGIRKVLGASVAQISLMLSNDFITMMVIAFVIASPISWWIMSKWLQGFAHRIDLQWWMFGLAGGASLIVAILTVSFQSIKAALANPVKSLRSE